MYSSPGLETNRPNLLLGLIIRQRPKRDFLPVDDNETACFIPETAPLPATPKPQPQPTEEDATAYLTSLAVARPKDEEKDAEPEGAEAPMPDSPEEGEEEGGLQDSLKPLRFLPGVLRCWGGALPPMPDLAGSDDPLNPTQIAIPGLGDLPPPPAPPKPPPAPRLDRFVIKKKEPKPANPEAQPPSLAEKPAANAAAIHSAESVSLKDKPTDVSTGAYLASLSAADSNRDSSPASEAPSADTPSPVLKPAPPSGILKKSSAYSNSPAPVPIPNTRSYPAPTAKPAGPPKPDHLPQEGASSHSSRGPPAPSQPGPPGPYPPARAGAPRSHARTGSDPPPPPDPGSASGPGGRRGTGSPTYI